MKKSVIIITALIYIVAIIVVAFLGFVAEIHNPPIYAEDIVMVLPEEEVADFPNFPQEPYTYINTRPIYDVVYNEDANPDSEVEEERYKYRFIFKSYSAAKWFFLNDNELKLNLKPYSSLGECENQGLKYSIAQSRKNSLEVTEDGIVKFKVDTQARDEDITVTTKDGTDISIHINIYW